MIDADQLGQEILAQFDEPNNGTFKASACPVLAAAAASLQLDLGEDGELRNVVIAAVSLVHEANAKRSALHINNRAALAGAAAFFYIGSEPTTKQLDDIRSAHGGAPILPGEQRCRYSWAKWQDNVTALPQAPKAYRAPHERGGRNARLRYASALTDALVEAFEQPELLRAHLRGAEEPRSISADLSLLLQVTQAYTQDTRLDEGQYVTRDIEAAVMDDLIGADRSSVLVIGDAGYGKSTLLWSIYIRLQDRADTVALFLPASWVMQQDDNDITRKITGALVELRDAGLRPVLIIDTVDLLLHRERDRDFLIRLLAELDAKDLLFACSTRPQEAVGLAAAGLREHHLDAYSDDELGAATTALAAKYCPDEAGDDIVDQINAATARQLPVSEVCRSPLLLRMLFDLAAPHMPELDDLDVTRLFEAYWDRRVVRDARTEAAARLRVQPAEDLSAVAGQAAIGLLVYGSPELTNPELYRATTTIRSALHVTDETTLRLDLDTLTERGVLTPTGDLIGFFHQTMFEFAAAKGLLRTPNPRIIKELTRRTTVGDGDLFVGAILEQVLILAGTDPLLRDRMKTTVAKLLAHPSDAVAAIGVAAWIHHEHLIDDPVLALKDVRPAALARGAALIPTIAGKDVHAALWQLARIWIATDEPLAQEAVIDALARLGAREPHLVIQVADKFDINTAITDAEDGYGLVKATLRLLNAVTPGLSRDQLREALITLLRDSAGASSLVTKYMKTKWNRIGDEHLLDQMLPLMAATAPTEYAAQDVGELLATQWQLEPQFTDPQTWKETVDEALSDPGDDRSGTTTMLVAVIEFAATFTADDARLEPTLWALLTATDQRTRAILDEMILPDLLQSDAAAASVLAAIAKRELATIGLDAQRGPLTYTQTVLLDILIAPEIPSRLVRQILPNRLERRDWLAHPRLTALVPIAAHEGYRSAEVLLEQMATTPADCTGHLEAVLSTDASILQCDGNAYDQLITIAIAARDIGALQRFIIHAAYEDPRLARNLPRLFTLAKQLLIGNPDEQEQGAELLGALQAEADDPDFSWLTMRAIIEHITSPQIREDLLATIGVQDDPESVDARRDYLTEYIHINPDADTPLTSGPRANDDASLAATAHSTLLDLLALYGPHNDETWAQIAALGLHAPDVAGVVSHDGRFILVCQYLQRLIDTDVPSAGRRLADYLEHLAAGQFTAENPQLWREELTEITTRVAIDSRTDATISRLITISATSDIQIAHTILDALATKAYPHTRTRLLALAQADISPEIRAHLTTTIRNHDRITGTRTFPELLPVLAP